MKDFRDLKVWHRAYSLSLDLYRTTKGIPDSERFGLTSQIRRAAVSICANVAEGCGRSGSGEFLRFLQIAMGSASELECHLMLARDLRLLASESGNSLLGELVEVRKMLSRLIAKVQADRQIPNAQL